MRPYLSFASGPTSNYSNEVELYTAVPPLIHYPMEAWQSHAPHVPSREGTLSISLHLSCMDSLRFILLLYSHAYVVVRWKNTLFLGIDACFKLKLKDRGFKDPDLGTGLAYMVNEDAYQTYLGISADTDEPVSFYCFLLHSFDQSLIAIIQASTCGPDFNAVNQAYTKNTQGYKVTGVAAVLCRHAFVHPNGVVDLQKGER